MSKPSARSAMTVRRRVSAFGLVEVTLAPAIMAFAFLPVLGLLANYSLDHYPNSNGAYHSAYKFRVLSTRQFAPQ